MSSGLI
jgi:hypothetical protein